nr:MAG TPA: hypothetical protein [Caudoviricetes sp.]
MLSVGMCKLYIIDDFTIFLMRNNILGAVVYLSTAIVFGGSTALLMLFIKENSDRCHYYNGNRSKTVVENVLTSTSTTTALSSAQGKILNDLITSLTARV